MIGLRTLADGGQSAAEVAGWLTAFLEEARSSLELAHYHLELSPEPAARIVKALRDAAARGVAVRIVYNLDFENPIPVPPPPTTDDDLILALGVPAKAISGVPDLMHHKYVVRDRETVLTGSANWTDDSWERQENALVTVRSPDLAARFLEDFEQLWTTGSVEASGKVPSDPIRVGDATVRPWFSPGGGEAMSHRIARALASASRRIRILSPLVTEGAILGSLAQVVSDGKVDVAGAVDLTQVQRVIEQWRENGNASWKVPMLQRALTTAPFSGKPSTPWSETSLHDFMHAKLTVTDDTVFVGSYNLSHSGERNAENMLEIEEPGLAERAAGFVDAVRGRYPRVELGSDPFTIGLSTGDGNRKGV